MASAFTGGDILKPGSFWGPVAGFRDEDWSFMSAALLFGRVNTMVKV